jgi:predicted tellurium resistance membrane protein TerC
MEYLLSLLQNPNAWAAFATLTVMELVLGIDNLVFISVLSNKLPEHQRSKARKIGIASALVLRLILLGTAAAIIQLTNPVFEIFEIEFSWKDIVLICGGLFLVWKATKEIHHLVDPSPESEKINVSTVTYNLLAVVGQILLLDIVFSIDSIITAVGMTTHLPIMFAAVIITVIVMLIASDPLARFINSNPTIVMLALGFLLLIGTTLIADGFGVHFPKGYIYTAMGFSIFVEGLNMLSKKARQKQVKLNTN